MIIDDGIRKAVLTVYPKASKSKINVLPPVEGVKYDELIIAMEVPWRGVIYTKNLKGVVEIQGSEKNPNKE